MPLKAPLTLRRRSGCVRSMENVYSKVKCPRNKINLAESSSGYRPASTPRIVAVARTAVCASTGTRHRTRPCVAQRASLCSLGAVTDSSAWTFSSSSGRSDPGRGSPQTSCNCLAVNSKCSATLPATPLASPRTDAAVSNASAKPGASLCCARASACKPLRDIADAMTRKSCAHSWPAKAPGRTCVPNSAALALRSHLGKGKVY
mmetsp:Transcript_130039/g.324121  ORF Transcript_130039/g.324121 Transcript_130039/m.324121 type:complete len:204 (+) Transcript_130039:123-734(+)